MTEKEKNEIKKAWLAEYRESMNKTRSLSEELQRWKDIAERVNQSLNPAPAGGGGSDKIGRAAVMIADLQRSIEEEICIAERKRAERIKAIEAVRNTRYRTVLRMYYISGMSFFKISCILGKSERNIQDIHKKAIKQVKIDGQD